MNTMCSFLYSFGKLNSNTFILLKVILILFSAWTHPSTHVLPRESLQHIWSAYWQQSTCQCCGYCKSTLIFLPASALSHRKVLRFHKGFAQDVFRVLQQSIHVVFGLIYEVLTMKSGVQIHQMEVPMWLNLSTVWAQNYNKPSVWLFWINLDVIVDYLN